MSEVVMPKMGDGMSEGTIINWLIREGDSVRKGDAIAEVETDKANVEIPAEESGVLSKIIVPAGHTVPVGEVIAQIGDRAAPPARDNGAGGRTPVQAEPAPEREASAAAPSNSLPTPPAASGATQGESEPPVDPRTHEEERVKASPLARKKAVELGVNLATVRGTGPGGRIVERDLQEQPASTVPTPASAVPPPALSVQDIQPTRMREAIARRTVQSKQTVPHFYVTMLVEMDRAMALLEDLNADSPQEKVTVNHVIIKACAVALGIVPRVNATWTAQGVIRLYKEAHIGMAVGVEDGLVVPVVRDCQSKTLRQIAADARYLVERARGGQLKPEDYSGATFSTSNLGMMGVDEFIAIINPPEAAILAIGAIERIPVVAAGSDEIEIRSRMKITLSSDHRVLDGVVSAQFLQEVKKALEAPFRLVG
ncbi:MAG TPA: dihydrolipoamide acetyltransferase family protein [Chthonomonadales bacterium]|nr:dihydrolipoamide acetyltransferase family protein [Chthonomonadales bacterium]